MGETDEAVGRYVEIRQIAQALGPEFEGTFDLRATVEALCWLISRRRKSFPHAHLNKSIPKTVKIWGNPDLNLLSAAAYFNLLPLSKRLLAEGNSPTSHDYLFPPPIQIAAQHGSIAMLQLFQAHLPGTQLEPFSITGAAIRGDMEILKLVLPPSMEASDDDGDKTEIRRFQSLEYAAETGRAVEAARSYASCPMVYNYLSSALVPYFESLERSSPRGQNDYYPPSSQSSMYSDLMNYAHLGDTVMMCHLLHLGVPVQMSPFHDSPLVMACRGFHYDAVELLLKCGADPNFFGERLRPFLPLHESAIAVSIARKLLDHGAIPNRERGGNPGRPTALRWAFEREHTSMISLLLERGASFDGFTNHPSEKGSVGKSIAKSMTELGYDSMVEILREHGF